MQTSGASYTPGYSVREQDCPFSEEILITKSDLEQRDQQLKLIQTRLDDSVVERDFQLRMKDVSYGDQIKELTETFVAEANLLMDKYKRFRTLQIIQYMISGLVAYSD